MTTTKKPESTVRVANTLVLLLALLIGLILVNVASTYLYGRVDLTEYNVNSLSPESIEVLRSLVGDEGASPLEVRVYISAKLPDTIKGQWNQDVVLRGLDTKFRDKLSEYHSHAKEMVELVEVSEDTVTQAEEAGIQPFVADEATVTEGKLEMTRYVLGATFHYEGEVEVYEQALDPGNFEFEITKRLLRLKDRVENGRKIRHLTEASDELWEAVSQCSKELTAFELKEEEKQEVSGIEGLLKPIENMEEEAAALAKNRDRIEEKCAGVAAILEEKGIPLKGEHKRFDAFLSGLGTKDQKGGIEAYVQVYKSFSEKLADDPPNAQQIMELKKVLGMLLADAKAFRDMLKKSPGQRRIGFVCGHDEFCPFPSDTPIFDPKVAQMMGQNNPIHEQFIGVALQVQERVNQTLRSIGNGLFTEQDFDVTRVDASHPIADDIAALVIFGARQKLGDRARYEIDQFVMGGGTLLVLVNNFDVSLVSFSEEAIKKMGPFSPNPNITNDYSAINSTSSNADELLAPYGIGVNKDLIMDAVHNNKVTLPHSVRRGKTKIHGTKDFDYAALVTATEFDRTNAMVRNLPGLTLPFASSLEYEAVEGNDVEVSELVKSSEYSVRLMDPSAIPVIGEGDEAEMLKLMPPELKGQLKTLLKTKEPDGPHTLALMITGTFQSAFKDKAEPAKPEKKKPEEGMPEEPDVENERLNSGKGRILVVGSSLGIPPLTLEGIFKDVSLQQIQQGEVMVPQVRLHNWEIKLGQYRRAFNETIPTLFNMLDWAVQRSALAEIRAKNNDFRPLEKTSEEKQRTITYAAVGGLPLLFILFGVAYWQLRVSRRRSLSKKTTSARAATPKQES
jgi:hypothetical protein